MNTIRNIFQEMREDIEQNTRRGAWNHGVMCYAVDLVDDLEEAVVDGYCGFIDLNSRRKVEETLLNGASDWKQFSWGGSALIYDGDIAELLCNPSELKKTRHGEKRPNSREEWLDVQARALWQASRLVLDAVDRVMKAFNAAHDLTPAA